MTSLEASPVPQVVRVFSGHEQARAAIEALKAVGVEAHAMSVVARSTAEAEQLDRETGVGLDLEESVQAHPLRDLLDWLGRIEAFTVPGFSSVLATGDLGLHLSAASPAPGAITAALVDLGLSVDQAGQFERDVLDGGILLVVDGAAAASAAAQAILGP
jgi:hypothetical protein